MSIHPQSLPFTPQQSQPHPLAFPALHLHPHNDTFIPKQIVLNPNGTKVKIGRQTNQKTVPNSSNGYFDSKVLSRAHAEVWTEDGKVLIRDVKSSNGTFINGDRLSAEGLESEAFELHTHDIVEFGIDIIAEDTKAVVHHKVATKVFLVLNAEDALAAANFYRPNPSDGALNRRTNRPGVFAGGSFDHVLNRLQSELEKSRATGQELSTLNSAMNEIHDTLGGGTGPPPPLPPPYGGRMPPLNHQTQGHQAGVLQSQLSETQASLHAHIEKMKAVEGVMGEQEQLKREVGELRDQLELMRRDPLSRGLKADTYQEEEHMRGRVSPVAAMLELQERQASDSPDDDDDDNRSVASNDTVTWITSSLQKTHLKPNGTPLSEADQASSSFSSSVDAAKFEAVVEQNQHLSHKLEAISAHVEDTLKMGQTLLEQHRQSNETVNELRAEIERLKHEQDDHRHNESVQNIERIVLEKVESRWAGWKEVIEAGWRKQQENWDIERLKLLRVIADWEAKAAVALDEAPSDDEEIHRLEKAGRKNPLGSSPSNIKKLQKKTSNLNEAALVGAGAVEVGSSSGIRSPKKVRKRPSGPSNTTLEHNQARRLDSVSRPIDEHSDASDANKTRPTSAGDNALTSSPTTKNEDRKPGDGVKGLEGVNGSAEREGDRGGPGRSLIDVR